MSFPAVHPALARALTERNYVDATPVQLAVLQPDASGRDMLVSAQTGSGKTVAFGIALAHVLLGSNETFERAAEPLALVIAPTRELALQVQRELAWLYAKAGARIASCVGGMDIRGEKAALAAGAHIVVGTPGRLRDHLERRRFDASKLRAVVLDEADEMLDLGFREDLQFILDATPAERQTLLFSATLPKSITQLAKQYQRDALRIETATRNQAHGDIEYRAVRVGPGDSEAAVVNLLRFHESPATLVFCSTREGVRRMHDRLTRRGFFAVALSGELSQTERTQALQSLRDGRSRVLVATDVAARGLDLPDLALVIHADLPNDPETLLHRSGRTGRAGRKGMCALIVSNTKRRRAEQLISAANITAKWENAPSADSIRARDQERLIQDPIFAEPSTETDLALGRALLAGRTADEIAIALVRFHRTRLPEPENVGDVMGAGPRERSRHESAARPSRERYTGERHTGDRSTGERSTDDRARAPRDRRPNDRGPSDRNPSDRTGHDASFAPARQGSNEARTDAGMVWFQLNIGRVQNADPRWLLPLICRAGGVTKSEIGAIRIFDRETRFEVASDHAEAFTEALATSAHKEGKIERSTAPHDYVDAPPRDAGGFKPERGDARGDTRGRRSSSDASRSPGAGAGKGKFFKSKDRSYGSPATGAKPAGASPYKNKNTSSFKKKRQFQAP